MVFEGGLRGDYFIRKGSEGVESRRKVEEYVRRRREIFGRERGVLERIRSFR